MPIYFDAHSHLNFPQYDEDRADVLARMKEQNVWTITVGTNGHTSKEAVELAEKHNGIFATVGIHPTEAYATNSNDSISSGISLEKLLQNRNVVGVGECGFDYFRVPKEDVHEIQKKLFTAQIELALQHDKPLMLHMRPSKKSMDAYEDGLDVLVSYKKEYGGRLRGNSHFFVGDTNIARRFLELDFTISFDGPVTFTRDYDEVVRYVPLGMLLAETDAPFAAPEPHRGKRNEPTYVRYVIGALAAICKEDEETLRQATVANTKHVFGLS